MSAWIVSTRHIDALVQAALKSGKYGTGPLHVWFAPGAPEDLEQVSVVCSDADAIGRMLLAENIASVAFRYPADAFDELPGRTANIRPEAYHYRNPGRFTPVELLKAIDCYEYQSCEHPGWRYSQAKAFCEALRERLVGMLPGYDAAAWAIDDYEEATHDGSADSSRRA